jgi:uncharacterized protein (TIGR02145 family)
MAPAVQSCTGFVNGTKREHYGMMKEQFCDERDGKKYVYVNISEQVWMAENLNYNASGSKCYDDDASNCVTYGRLYNWATAMALPASCNSTYCASQINAKHTGICPTGWHMPNISDWYILMDYVQTDNGSTYNPDGSASIAGKYLKATSGWENQNGEDKYGFAAFPGGHGYLFGFDIVGISGRWCSSSEYNNIYGNEYANNNYYLLLGIGFGEHAYFQEHSKSDMLISIRCLKD